MYSLIKIGTSKQSVATIPHSHNIMSPIYQQDMILHHFEMDLIRVYHGLGMEYKNILSTLASSHGIIMSLATLKRKLRQNGLRRRVYDDLGAVVTG